MSEGRTKKAFINVLTGITGRLFVFFFAFSVRTIFIRTLGAEYNGINGTFNNILSVLCLADLGIYNVLNYSLYSALKNNETEKVKGIISSFRQIYNLLVIFILGVGLVVMAFLRLIIHSDVPMNEVIIYYLLYLANAAASYIFVYKTTIITADQNQYIVNLTAVLIKVLTYLCQMIILLLWKNLYAYLIVQIFFTVVQNIVLNIITKKKYPYLAKISSADKHPLTSELKQNLISVLEYRAAFVMLNNTDNIIISSILGTVMAGLYSNYYMLFQYVDGLIYTAGTGLVASVGNLNTEKNNDKSFGIFNVVVELYAAVGCICTACFMCCVQKFVPIWIGKEYLLSDIFTFMSGMLFYTNIVMSPVSIFRETAGIFKEVRFELFVSAAINIVLSFVLGRSFGIEGIVIATIIAKLSIQFWYEPRVLYKNFFNSKLKFYYINQLRHFIVMLIAVAVSINVSCLSEVDGIFDVVLRGIIALFTSSVIFLVFNIRDKNFRQLVHYIKIALSKGN